MARFDWVGTGAELSLRGEGHNVTVVVDMDSGAPHRFSVEFNGTVANGFVTKLGRKNYTVWAGSLPAGEEASLRLLKATEADMKTVVTIYGGEINGATLLLRQQQAEQLKIDVYGDSDSAAFAVDGKGHLIKCALCQGTVGCYENFAHGWVYQAASLLAAEFAVQAVSGIGVVKNAGRGLFCFTDLVLGMLIGRTLASVDKNDYNGSAWGRADAVVLFIGGNDYANLFPPSEEPPPSHI